MDDKVFNMLEKMYSEFVELKGEVKGLKSEFVELKGEVTEIKKQVTKIEVDHGNKLEVLFDGYKQNTKLLEEIRDEVARHEEFIIKRVK